MTSYTIETATAQRKPVQLTAAIAQGAAGTIHRVIGMAGVVAKLYKDPKSLAEYEEKIGAMLAAPPSLTPFVHGGRTYVQIAWPTGKVFDSAGHFAGFVMPEVDFQASTELENMLQKSARKQKKLPEFYAIRVLLAANMAALCAELHKLGHFMVDMKPVNMRFYPSASYMAILDTDGFSINGTRRLPAQQFSDEYIAPEGKGKSPEKLGVEQDQFALAVIIFRLLNNGIHPFQGVDLVDHPTNLQDRIFAGLYAYGLKRNGSVNPTPSTIHDYFEKSTRILFDRAFAKPHDRPSAEEWRDHLNKFIVEKTLVRCADNEAEHAHFSKGCGLCAQDKRRSSIAKGGAPAPTVQSSAIVLGTLLTGSKAQSQRSSQSPVGVPSATRKTAKIVAAIACIVAIIGFAASNMSKAPPAPNTAEVPSAPIKTFKIANAVLATTLDNNKPKDISRTFAKGATMILYFDYQGAKPNLDTILVKVNGGGETSQPCELSKLMYVDGSFNCRWIAGASADQVVTIELNGSEIERLPFKVTQPSPPRPPIDIRPPAQTIPPTAAPLPQPPMQPFDNRMSSRQPPPANGPISADLSYDSGGYAAEKPAARAEPPLKMSGWALMVKEQLDNCWKRPAGRREPQGVQVSLGISLSPQGVLDQPPRPVRAVSPSANSYLDRVVRAMYACQPFRLPPARFNEWRYLEMSFSDAPFDNRQSN